MQMFWNPIGGSNLNHLKRLDFLFLEAMSSSSNTVLKNGNELTIELNKLNKQTQDQLEMNSINSTILLNPSSIKNNHPVINQLYQPLLNQRQPETIDLSSIGYVLFFFLHFLKSSFFTHILLTNFFFSKFFLKPMI